MDHCTDEEHFGLARLVTPSADDVTQTLIGFNQTHSIVARLQSPRLPNPDKEFVKNPEVLLYLNPTCQYRVEVRSNLGEMWSQIVRFYAPMMSTMVMAVALVTFSQQLKQLAADG